MPTKKHRLRAYVTPEEYEQIIHQAEQYNLSVSAFVRKVALGEPLPNVDYAKTRLELLRINADMGRLGGLFKFWLGDKDRSAQEATPQLRELLHEIEKRQLELKEVVRQIK
ncbi:pirin [Oceanidesulfovibrio indonesiensis]|uniref:Pirin n=1 Tax=Oceanidesulfovibrio indonesiensis TaxID=54767 RepID=A0A7M3MAF0_9BACT|nr:pirin [Oceanidesulfovibrio indonesiensis]TVM14024.1 pirin [Oceanidesulfovibrio indonesiensis]